VVPFATAIALLPLELYDFEEADMPSVAFSESLWGNVSFSGDAQVKRSRRVIDRATQLALSASESLKLIEQAIREKRS